SNILPMMLEVIQRLLSRIGPNAFRALFPRMRRIAVLDERLDFPPVECANEEGLLAIGGDLSADRLISAYRRGIFPWYGEEEPILWWSPDPRMVLEPDELKVSRSLRSAIRRGVYEVSFDTAFEQVMRGCATVPRRDAEGTWI